MFGRDTRFITDTADGISRLREALDTAEAVVAGAGAGLSTSAGFVYSGERFRQYFSDFAAVYGFEDMYSGGFYPYPSDEIRWAYMSRYIYINRYMDPPKPVYQNLLSLLKPKDYFVITTNVDHCFQKAGFDKDRLFYTQGDYGLFQCGTPCHQETYDNAETIRKMVESQGFVIAADGSLTLPKGRVPKMSIPAELIPRCPVCGEKMTMNLRGDDRFVENAGWHRAADRYSAFLESHQDRKTLFLELGVGGNTPGIIKVPFLRMTWTRKNAVYACLNYGEAFAPAEIADKCICINADIGETLEAL